MGVEAETSLPSQLDAALGLVCRLAADLASAPWCMIALPDARRRVWSGDGDAAMPQELEAAALAGPAPPPGSVELRALEGGYWIATAALGGEGGRLVVCDTAPLRLDAARRAQVLDAASLAAARIAAESRAPDAALAMARVGWFTMDRARQAGTWSRELFAIHGYDPQRGAPSLAMSLAAYPPEGQAEILRAIGRTWETGEEVSIATTLTPLGGGKREVIIRVRADPPGPGGHREILRGVVFDVTEARSFDQALQRERELLRTTLDHMDQGIIVVEPDMRVPVLSRRLTELVGLPEAFIDIRPSFPEIVAYQFETGLVTREALDEGINACILNNEELPTAHVYDRETPDGRILEVRTTRLPQGGFVRTFADQTARRRRDDDILRAQAEYRLLFENSVNGIYRTTPDGRVLRANPALARFSGYASEAEFLTAIRDARTEWYVDPAQRAEIVGILESEGRISDFVYEAYRHRTGERVWVSESAWVIRDDKGEIVAYEGTVIDVTERKRASDQIAYLARHDALTGLANRIQFTERLNAALSDGDGSVAVMFFDLDRFKAVNDTLGHPAGDELLRILAGRIEALIGAEDLVARFGGDEFALMMPRGDHAAAAALAERVLAAARAPMLLRGREITVGASIGIALAPTDGGDPTELMKSADVALYRAKAEGRDTWRRFATEMDAAVQERQQMEFELRKAIERDELSLLYQPIFRVDDPTPTGFEALLRWTHPEWGAVPPQVFIAIAEETHLIQDIGRWALTRACAEAAAWPGSTSLWVNVSAMQLAQDDFEAVLDAALAASGFAPGRLVLEITETSLMEGRVNPGPLLTRMRARGLRIALDDFGTGYSSLGYLHRYAFDVIKVDQSFVRGMDEPATAAILATVVDLGRRLGMATVAEGVETEGQLAAMRAAGCVMVQGHLFGPLVAASCAAAVAG